MRILMAGDWHSDVYEGPLTRTLRDLGHDVIEFKWYRYFRNKSAVKNVLNRVQNKFLLGPKVDKLNQDLIHLAKATKPKLVFVFRGSHLRPETIDEIKKSVPGIKVFGYNNDDPFSGRQPRYYWRHFIESLPVYDRALAFRNHNVTDYIDAGAKKADLFRAWFIPERHKPVELSEKDKAKYGCDVTFVGHYEADGREKTLIKVIEGGVDFKLFGPEWDAVIEANPAMHKLRPVYPVQGPEYNKALNAAKIALCFLSKINRDTYTIRCFEVPAIGTLLLSEYSDDLATLFKPGVEADYFKSPEECLDKVRFYLKNEDIRKKVARAGYERVRQDGQDIVSRAKQILKWAES